MRICLATIHLKEAFTPLALLCLKAYLVEQRGVDCREVTLLEFTRHSPLEEIVERILEVDPAVVGLSCYVWNVKALMCVAERIKRVRPGITIVVGGPEVGPRGSQYLQEHWYLDVLVKSEGEAPFADIVERLATGGDVAEVKGICGRANGEVVDSGFASTVQNVDELPSPHQARYGDFTGRIICLETQRGCVFRCNFCFYNKDYSIRNRRFDLDRVKDEIRYWLNRDVDEIYLMDPVFNLNTARAKEICRFIIEHNHRQTRFHAEIWAEFIDEEMAHLFREANFQFLEVGLQTTDERVLQTVERRLRLQRFLDGIAHLRKYRLKFELQLIYGLPGESVTSFRQSLNFASRLEPHRLAVFPLMVLPGTELWRKAGALGLEVDSEPPYYLRSHDSMSADDVAHGRKIADAVERIGNLRAVRALSREPDVTFAEVLDAWVQWEQEHRQDSESWDDVFLEFLTEFCARREISDEFYRTCAAYEFAKHNDVAFAGYA